MATTGTDDLTADLDRTDPNQRDLARELERLAEAVAEGTIHERDYELVVDFWTRYDRGESAVTTQETHLSNLRKAAERIRKSEADADALADAGAGDLKELMAEYRSGSHPDVKDGGIVPSPHQGVLRVFYRWHADLGVDPEEIELDSDYNGRELSPEDLWTAEEVDAWLDATRNGGTRGFRDRAMFALALATGQRIDAIRTLRLEHISKSGPTMDLRLNEAEGNLKGANGSRPVLWAKHYLRPWLENHPYRDDPEAGLFCVIPGRGQNRQPDGTARDPLDGSTMRDIVRDYAREAGIEKPTYFHILRHSAITRMVLEGLKEQQIKRIAGWDPDSSQFGTYVHLADELSNDAVRESLGLPTSGVEHPVIGRPTLDWCPECGEALPPDTDTCDSCGEPITYSADERSVESTLDLSEFDVLGREAVRDLVIEELEKLDQTIMSSVEAAIEDPEMSDDASVVYHSHVGEGGAPVEDPETLDNIVEE